MIDTQAGRVLSTTPIPDRVHYKIYPTSSRMAVSADGRKVYLKKLTGPPSGDTPVALAAFDTVRERFLDGAIGLGACGASGFVPVPNQNQVGFHCAASNEIAHLPARRTRPGDVRVLGSAPVGKAVVCAARVLGRVGARVPPMGRPPGKFVAGGDGAIAEVNLALGRVTETPVLGSQDEVVVPFASPDALDRARFFVGVGDYDGEAGAREIRIFDTNTR